MALCVVKTVPGNGLPDSEVYGDNMGPIWVLSAPDGPHVGPMNLVIRVASSVSCLAVCTGKWPLCTVYAYTSEARIRTVTSFERHSISNHRWLDCLFKSMFKLTAKKISQLCLTVPLAGEFTVDRWTLCASGNAESVFYIITLSWNMYQG